MFSIPETARSSEFINSNHHNDRYRVPGADQDCHNATHNPEINDDVDSIDVGDTAEHYNDNISLVYQY